MNITLMAHDKKKELMVQFCTAYKSILSKHCLSATATTAALWRTPPACRCLCSCRTTKGGISRWTPALLITKLIWC